MIASLRTNWIILKTSVEERLVYRGDFVFATLIRFLPIVTQIFLWGAIYGIHTSSPIKSIKSYSYHEMVAYYLLVMVGRAFSSMPGLANGIANDVRDGTIKKILNSAHRYAGLYVLGTYGSQAGLLSGSPRPVYSRVLSLSPLLFPAGLMRLQSQPGFCL